MILIFEDEILFLFLKLMKKYSQLYKRQFKLIYAKFKIMQV